MTVFPGRLRVGTTQYLHTLPLIEGAVSVPGLDTEITVASSIDECTLRTLKGDFDVGEFSLATFVKVCEQGDNANRFVGVPVFSKKLVSQYAFCRTEDTLDGHKSLAGRRIAVPQFWVTAAIWHRWFLESAGVDPASVTWCPLSKDRIEGMPYPSSLKLDWSLVGRKPTEVIRSGAADCFIFARRPADLKGMRYLAKHPVEETLATVKRTGVAPITHVLALKREVHEANPRVAQALLDLFSASLAHGDNEIGHHAAQFLPLADMQLDQTIATLGEGWNRYGWARNGGIIRTFCDAAAGQGFVGKVDIDRIFLQIG